MNTPIKEGELSMFNGWFPASGKKPKEQSDWQKNVEIIASGSGTLDGNFVSMKEAFEAFSGDYIDASAMYSIYSALYHKVPIQRMLTLSEELVPRYITVGKERIDLGESISIVDTYNAIVDKFGDNVWAALWSNVDDSSAQNVGSQEEDDTPDEDDWNPSEKAAGTHILSDRNYTQRYRLLAATKGGIFIKIAHHYALILMQHGDPEIAKVLKCIKFCKRTKPRSMEYIVAIRGGFTSMDLPIREQNIDINKQYNDDLPDEEIRKHIQSNTSGIILLHGAPGTGKTSYIRHLALTVPRRFVFLDKSMFGAMTDASFIELLSKKKNATFVLEDCEDVLKDRTEYNEAMSTILNLSDGILGDGFNIKFLCTFNCPLDKIDSALTRKGRLKLKYEFRPLDKDKANALLKELGSDKVAEDDMTLADIYGIDKENGFKKPQEKPRMGF